MLEGFILALRSAYQEAKIAEPRIIGLDLRPRSHLTSIAMHFMVFGSQILCLRAQLREQDPGWGILVKAGKKSVIHIPSVLVTIREEDLHLQKGNEIDFCLNHNTKNGIIQYM